MTFPELVLYIKSHYKTEKYCFQNNRYDDCSIYFDVKNNNKIIIDNGDLYYSDELCFDINEFQKIDYDNLPSTIDKVIIDYLVLNKKRIICFS